MIFSKNIMIDKKADKGYNESDLLSALSVL